MRKRLGASPGMHRKAAQRNAEIALQTAQSAERDAQMGRCSIAMQGALDAMRFVGRVDESLMDVPGYRGADRQVERARQSVQNVVRFCSLGMMRQMPRGIPKGWR